MSGWPALLRTFFAELSVAGDDGPHEVVDLVQALGWEGLSVGIALTQVGVMADGERVGPGPNVPTSGQK